MNITALQFFNFCHLNSFELQFDPFTLIFIPFFHSFFLFLTFQFLGNRRGFPFINRIPPLFNFFVSIFPCQLPPRGFCPRALLCDELVPSTLMEIHLTSALLLSTS